MATAEIEKPKQYKLSRAEKERIADRINYFRTMPSQILKAAADLEGTTRHFSNLVVDHTIKSILVNGRIMILRCS